MKKEKKTKKHESASATTEQALESKTTQMMGVSEREISAEQEVRVQAPADAGSAETINQEPSPKVPLNDNEESPQQQTSNVQNEKGNNIINFFNKIVMKKNHLNRPRHSSNEEILEIVDPNGDVNVVLSGIGDGIIVRKDELMAEVFRLEPMEDSEIIHIDGDPTNCAIYNLKRVRNGSPEDLRYQRQKNEFWRSMCNHLTNSYKYVIS